MYLTRGDTVQRGPAAACAIYNMSLTRSTAVVVVLRSRLRSVFAVPSCRPPHFFFFFRQNACLLSHTSTLIYFLSYTRYTRCTHPRTAKTGQLHYTKLKNKTQGFSRVTTVYNARILVHTRKRLDSKLKTQTQLRPFPRRTTPHSAAPHNLHLCPYFPPPP